VETHAVLEVEDAKGRAVEAHVFADPGGSMANQFMFAMGRLGEGLTGKSEGSQQLRQFDRAGVLAERMAVVRPPVLPEMYAELYRRDPVNRACVDAKVRNVAMQGWRVRPRNQVMPGFSGGGQESATDKPDADVRDRILAVLEGAQPDYSFTEMLSAVWTDVESQGDGYIEVVRKNDGDLHAFLPVKGVTMRLARDLPGYVQIRGQSKRWFAQYGHDYTHVVLRREDIAPAVGEAGKVEIEADPLFLPRGFTSKVADADLVAKAVGPDFSEITEATKITGDEVVVDTNEMLRFSTATPKDTRYGEPPVLSAIEDYLTAQNIRLFLLSYFDNATVPRMAIFVKGSDALAKSTVAAIEQWIKTQNKLDALNEVLVVELAEGADVQVERLSSEQLGDGGSFLNCRKAADKAMMVAHHTPPSIIFDIFDLNNAVSAEADRRFIETVVRPKQRVIEDKFNYIIGREFGTNEWVLDLTVPDLTELDARRQLWQMMLTRGAVTINEVRSELQLGDIAGGDEPFLLVPGQGLALVSMIAKGGMSEVTNQQQPPTSGGQMGASEKAGGLSHTTQCEIATACEAMGMPSEQIRATFPGAFVPADTLATAAAPVD